jgi:hypothetical protein
MGLLDVLNGMQKDRAEGAGKSPFEKNPSGEKPLRALCDVMSAMLCCERHGRGNRQQVKANAKVGFSSACSSHGVITSPPSFLPFLEDGSHLDIA